MYSVERIHDKEINSTDRLGLPSHLFDIASALVESDNKIKEKNVSRQVITFFLIKKKI